MKKLLLAASLGAVLAAPAFAQPAATYQPRTAQYRAAPAGAWNAPSYAPGGASYAPGAGPAAGPGGATSGSSWDKGDDPNVDDPAHWNAGNPFNYEVGGG